MAAEGEFPKVDGDIFYASEANRIAYANRYAFIGSSIQVGSQTGVTKAGVNNLVFVGSIHFTTGSLTQNTEINAAFDMSVPAAATSAWFVSGLGGNVAIQAGSAPGGAHRLGRFRATVGSPFTGFLHVKTITDDILNATRTNAEESQEHRTSPLVYAGSPWVLFYGSRS